MCSKLSFQRVFFVSENWGTHSYIFVVFNNYTCRLSSATPSQIIFFFFNVRKMKFVNGSSLFFFLQRFYFHYCDHLLLDRSMPYWFFSRYLRLENLPLTLCGFLTGALNSSHSPVTRWSGEVEGSEAGEGLASDSYLITTICREYSPFLHCLWCLFFSPVSLCYWRVEIKLWKGGLYSFPTF